MVQSKKVVLITGCSQGGIGYALCNAYAQQDCIVYATARRPEAMDGLKHPNIIRMKLDVTSDDAVQEVIKKIIDTEGRIDVLVNNAGANSAGALLDIPLDGIKSTFDINVFALLRLTKAVFPYMAARKTGEIVNIGSIGGDIPTPWNGGYSSSKAAVRGVSDVLWQELKPFNIHCTHVSAGAIKSNIAKNALAAGVEMPEGSLYKPYLDNMINRVWTSQGPMSLPAEEFARRVAAASLQPVPPRFMTLGGSSFLFYLFSWIPRSWALTLLWRKFSRLGGAKA